jgi:hypothetical protein
MNGKPLDQFAGIAALLLVALLLASDSPRLNLALLLLLFAVCFAWSVERRATS